jgi:hypothetical protein
MKHLILTLCLGFSIVVSAQEMNAPVSTKSQFSVEFLNGFGHRRYTQELGQLSNLDKINSTNLLMFRYRYKFSETLYAEAGWGFGTQIENKISPIFDYSGFDLWHYRTFGLARVDFSAAYQLFQHKQTSLNAKLRLGWHRFASFLSGSGYATMDDYFYSEMSVDGKRLPFVNFGFEYMIPTKRKDEFSIYLGYQYATNSYFSGTYTHEQSSVINARGTHSANMSAFQFGIAYTFTRAKKLELMAVEMSAKNKTKKEARAVNRYEKRAIDPNSQYITLGIGFGVNANKFSPKNDPFKSGAFGSFMWRGAYEIGFRNNIFFEADYFGFEFWQKYSIQSDGGSYGGGSNAFTAHFLNLGAQYKIQNKRTNFQFVNLHAGLGFGAHFSPKGIYSWGGGGSTTSQFTYTNDVRGNLMPVVYGGISKDFRITEKLLINLAYRHQLGFVNVYNTDYEYIENTNMQPRAIESKIDGTAFMLQFGLKYRIK